MALRARLATLRQEARAIERDLRKLGDTAGTSAGGRIDWNGVFEQLGTTFTAREMSELTGAAPRHVAVISYVWRNKGRIVGIGHGKFRKVKTR